MNLRRDSFFLDGAESFEFSLPHPPVSLPIILIVRNAVSYVFNELRLKQAELELWKEDEITVALHSRLENLRHSGIIPGFDGNTFEKIFRQHRVDTYDGKSVLKEPDMLFPLRDDSRKNVNHSKDGLVVECKPIDNKHPVNRHYCDNGMQRFVDGEYAWTMQDCLMLGYAGKGYSIADHLIPCMIKNDSIKKLNTINPLTLLNLSHDPLLDDLYVSKHDRKFEWRGNKGKATPIRIYHSCIFVSHFVPLREV